MTREDFAKRIRWERIIWVAGFVNVVAMMPQTWHLFRTHETAGLSVGMVFIYLIVQAAFCLEGYFKRNAVFFWCLGSSAIVSAVTIVLYYRYS